jgi:hypothetical protein
LLYPAELQALITTYLLYFTIPGLRSQVRKGDYYSQQVINSQLILAWWKDALVKILKSKFNLLISTGKGKSGMKLE